MSKACTRASETCTRVSDACTRVSEACTRVSGPWSRRSGNRFVISTLFQRSSVLCSRRRTPCSESCAPRRGRSDANCHVSGFRSGRSTARFPGSDARDLPSHIHSLPSSARIDHSHARFARNPVCNPARALRRDGATFVKAPHPLLKSLTHSPRSATRLRGARRPCKLAARLASVGAAILRLAPRLSRDEWLSRTRHFNFTRNTAVSPPRLTSRTNSGRA